MQIQKGLGNAALTILATCVALAAAELGLALFVPESNLRATASLNIYASDRELGYRLKSNVFRRVHWLGREVTVVTDGEGHRIPNRDEVVRTGPKLIVTGDSYVFGNEVMAEETFTWLLGTQLGLCPVNLGVGGYSLDQSARALSRYLEHVEADSVVQAVLFVYIGNDLEFGVAPTPPSVDLNGYLVRAGNTVNTLTLLRTWLTLNSRLAFFSQKAFAALDAKSTTPGGGGVGPPVATSVGAPRQSWIYQDGRYSKSSLDGHKGAFEALRAKAIRMKVPLTVVLMPEPGQVVGILSDVPNRKLLEVLAEVGLPAIDLLPLMREAQAATAAPLYHQAKFGHLSAKGNRVVAALLAERLRAGIDLVTRAWKPSATLVPQ